MISTRPKILLLLALAAFAGLAGCGGNAPPPPPQVFPPLNYDYLPPIVLNVADIQVQNNYVPVPAAATLIGQDPEPPSNALTAMLQHRLVAGGAPGTGTVTIETASIEPVGDNYVGAMTVRLDVASADGRSTGYTEASVSVTQTAPDSDADPNQVQAVLYGLTKQLMDQMNVQLQYQIQHNMANWISYGGTPAPAPNSAAANGGIQAEPLDAPGPTAPGAPTPAAPTPAAPDTGAAAPLSPQPLILSAPPSPEPADISPPLPPGSQSLGTLPLTPSNGTP